MADIFEIAKSNPIGERSINGGDKFVAGSELYAEHMNLLIEGVLYNTSITTKLLNLTYPVGSIYITTNNTNPKSLFGGEWEAWGQGRVPVGVNANISYFDKVEKPGGSADAVVVKHNHTEQSTEGHSHTVSSAGSHSHTEKSATHSHTTESAGSHSHTAESAGAHYHSQTYFAPGSGIYGVTSNSNWRTYTATGTTGAHTHSTNSQGLHNHAIYDSGAHTHTIESGGAHTHTTDSQGSHTHTINNTGVSGTGTNLQPYITCFMWKRIA